MITIYDIAKKTGLSAATVSKALNNYKGVSDNAKTMVMKAASEMGYTPNTSARTLITKKSWMLGVLYSEDVGSGITHPHFSQILDSVNKTAESFGYDIVFANKQFGDNVMSYYEHCRYRGVDGVIVAAGMSKTPEVECVVSSSLKCVSVEMIYPNVSTVISDNYMGTMQAMEYLYFLGHRKIAHLACPQDSLAGKERYMAYLEFMRMKGLAINEKHIVESVSFTRKAGNEATSKLLQQSWDNLPTAIFAGYDDLACTCQTLLQSQGFRVPEDISIVGFDNLQITEFMSPKITTVAQDRIRIGALAVETLVNFLADEANYEQQVYRIPTKLVIRDYCKRLHD